MYNILFSLPVHEHLEVVYEQIVNINTLNPNCAIIIHISPAFDPAKSVFDIGEFKILVGENVYINPNRIPTRAFDIIQAHISNFEYASSIIEFEYYAMIASNEMFIKSGLYDYIKGSDAGLDKYVVKSNTKRYTSNSALKDADLRRMLDDINKDTIFTSQIEGSYYKKDIYANIIKVINKRFDYKKITDLYAREEIYFPTVFWNLYEGNAKVKWMFTFIPWNRRITMNIRISDVKRLTSKGSYFCVKRIPRKLNDCIRIYLRQNCGYFNEVSSVLGLKHYSYIYILELELLKNIMSIKTLFEKIMNKLSK